MNHIALSRVSLTVRMLAIILATQILPVAAALADGPVVSPADHWTNISDAFTQQIGAHDIEPAYLRRCIGMIITPDGDIVMETSNKGVCISRDQGATWSVVADNKLTGRCENGFGFSQPYPKDGRMAFFCYDGLGGMSLDDGKTWQTFGNIARGVELGDVDWNTPAPQTVFGLTHEPFFTVLSQDGGKSWQMLDKGETGSGDETDFCLGVIDAKTLLRANPRKAGGIIELSADAGKTWTQVANYQVLGRSAVHYGHTLYWATTKGIIKSTNGKDWTLTGPGAEGAHYGPYFGATEQEFVVVTDQSFLKTEDGGKTWKAVAKTYTVPDIFHTNAVYCYFGWDPKHNFLYASGLGAAIYQLKL